MAVWLGLDMTVAEQGAEGLVIFGHQLAMR